MLYIILLLILAVLLFGSGAVIGFLGYVLGFIVAVIALFMASVMFGLDAGTIMLIVGAAFGAFLIFGAYANHKLEEMNRPLKEALAKMSPEERAKFEKMQADALAKVRAEAEAKKKYGV